MSFRVVETFYSLQGEGLCVGAPSVFVRLFGCNFQCPGFGRQNSLRSRHSVNPEDYRSLDQLPIEVEGCDSYPAWDKRFRHMSRTLSVCELAKELKGLVPDTQSGDRKTHLVITGGEPLLGWQKQYPEWLSMDEMAGFECVTFETNATQKLSKELADYIKQSKRQWLFSCSPKLSNSGELWEHAIKPCVLEQYAHLGNAQVILKFVVRDESCIKEIQLAVELYRERGFQGLVYLMPEGATSSEYRKNAVDVARLALRYGFHYSPRLQNDLWGNAWSS